MKTVLYCYIVSVEHVCPDKFSFVCGAFLGTQELAMVLSISPPSHEGRCVSPRSITTKYCLRI